MECMERLYTSNVSVSNGNTDEFERHIYCKKLIFRYGILSGITDADIGSLSLAIHSLINKFMSFLTKNS